jgi:hypothetical protein
VTRPTGGDPSGRRSRQLRAAAKNCRQRSPAIAGPVGADDGAVESLNLQKI